MQRVIELLDKKVETLFNRQDFEYLLERYMGYEAVQYFRDMIEEIEDSYNGQIDELTVQNENLREKLEDIRGGCAVSNKKIGNGFEAEFCEKLFQNGYWVHNLAQNAAGQPADVVAVKNGVPYLIDCKVCSGKVFSVSRIEDNQRMAMTLWRECLNGEGWFAVKFGENIYMITLSRLDSMVSKNLPEELFQRFALTFEEWLVADK